MRFGGGLATLSLCLVAIAVPHRLDARDNIAAATGSPASRMTMPSGALPPIRDAAALQSAMLAAHNAARLSLGMAPLAWDAALEGEAQGYAALLASTGRFQHSPEPRGPTPEGENLFTGTRGGYSYRQMIGFWLDERRFFRRGPTPNFSTTGRWQDVGHYTQAIWSGTTRVGCALSHNATDDYLVCRYTPPGNVVGQDVLGDAPDDVRDTPRTVVLAKR